MQGPPLSSVCTVLLPSHPLQASALCVSAVSVWVSWRLQRFWSQATADRAVRPLIGCWHSTRTHPSTHDTAVAVQGLAAVMLHSLLFAHCGCWHCVMLTACRAAVCACCHALLMLSQRPMMSVHAHVQTRAHTSTYAHALACNTPLPPHACTQTDSQQNPPPLRHAARLPPTAVRVRERGLAMDLPLLAGGMMRRVPMNTTSLPLNFFSSSRTRRDWILWKALSRR